MKKTNKKIDKKEKITQKKNQNTNALTNRTNFLTKQNAKNIIVNCAHFSSLHQININISIKKKQLKLVEIVFDEQTN